MTNKCASSRHLQHHFTLDWGESDIAYDESPDYQMSFRHCFRLAYALTKALLSQSAAHVHSLPGSLGEQTSTLKYDSLLDSLLIHEIPNSVGSVAKSHHILSPLFHSLLLVSVLYTQLPCGLLN